MHKCNAAYVLHIRSEIAARKNFFTVPISACNKLSTGQISLTYVTESGPENIFLNSG